MFELILLPADLTGPVIGYGALVIIIIFIVIYLLNSKGHKSSLKNFKVPDKIGKNGLLVPFFGVDIFPIDSEGIKYFFIKVILFEDRIECKSLLENFSLPFSKIKQIDYEKFPLILGTIVISDLIRISVGDDAATKEILLFFKRKDLPLSKKALEFLDSNK